MQNEQYSIQLKHCDGNQQQSIEPAPEGSL
jgi:hypothetical protein